MIFGFVLMLMIVQSRTKPNILFILADDLGKRNVVLKRSSKKIKRGRLAEEGGGEGIPVLPDAAPL